MKKVKGIMIGIICCLLVAGGFFVRGWFLPNKANNQASTLEASLKELCQLSVYDYNCREMVVHDHDGYKYDFIGLTENKFIATVDVKATIGVKLDDDNFNIKTTKKADGTLKSIEVTLPHCDFLQINAPQESVKVVEDKNGWFNNMNYDDYNDPIVEAKKQVKENAQKEGVLKEADQRLEKLIINHYQQLLGDDVTITVKQQ